MPVDKFGRTPKASQKITNVNGVSLGYVNNNFLRKGQAINMAGKKFRISAQHVSQSLVKKKLCKQKISSKRYLD